jgi:pyridoxal phosphate enzyme (YggS family)
MTDSGYLEAVQANLDAVRARIERGGGDIDAVTIVAVTKEQPDEAVAVALELGVVDIGENRADALVAKSVSAAGAGARWHFIGQIQRNKVSKLAPHVALWQSVDRAEVGAAIARHAPGAEVLVEVNLTGDPARAGVAIADVASLARDLSGDGLRVRGLMAVGPLGPPEAARDGFGAVVRCADELGLPIRSLGMSSDIEVAIACGSTMVRVGSALFGERAPRFRAARNLN